MPEVAIVSTRKIELLDITAQVEESIADQTGSAAILFVPHTTAGIVIQADGGLAVARDIEMALERLVDESWSWQHTEEEGERNPWSHVRAALTATSVTIPLRNGRLALGAFQSIFLCEFDGPRTRTVSITVF